MASTASSIGGDDSVQPLNSYRGHTLAVTAIACCPGEPLKVCSIRELPWHMDKNVVCLLSPGVTLLTSFLPKHCKSIAKLCSAFMQLGQVKTLVICIW